MDNWYYSTNGVQSGPVSQEEIAALVQNGIIPVNSIVWHADLPDWIPVSQSELAYLLPKYAAVRRYSLQDYSDPLPVTFLLTIFIGITVLLNAVTFVTSFHHRAALIKVQQQELNAEAQQELLAETNKISEVVQWTAIFLSLLYTTCLCFWTFRVVKNAHAISAVPMRFGPGWSVGYWFIPIWQLFRPFQTLADAFRAAEKPEHWKYAKFPAIVGWYWGLAIGAGFVIAGVMLLLFVLNIQEITRARVPASILLLNTVELFSCVWGTLLSLLFLALVWSLCRKERNTYFRLLKSPIDPAMVPPDLPNWETNNYFVPASNLSGWAIAAGYAGWCAVSMVFAPISLILGAIALWDVKKRQLPGRGRAMFGLVMGIIFTAAWVFCAFINLLK